MRQKLLTLATAVSAVLCVAVCVLWVRSYWRWDSLTLQTESRRIMVFSTGGGWDVEWLDYAPPPYGFGWRWESGPDPQSFRAFAWPCGTEWAGIGYRRLVVDGLVVHDRLCPSWFVALLTLTTPAAWSLARVRRQRTRKRLDAGRCLTCGYDLRATPDRCPECGLVPAAKGAR